MPTRSLPTPKKCGCYKKNLLMSHACGVGPLFPTEVVRAALCIRLNTLLAGHSGIQLKTAELLRDMLNKKIHPLVPSQGSVGASGDLCPLSHMALPVIGEGIVEYHGKEMPARTALQKEGLKPVDLMYKEGIALNNGTTFMAALATLAIYDAERLLHLSTLTAALTAESLCARTDAFDARIHAVRNHAGQKYIAETFRSHIKGSTFMNVDPSLLPGKKKMPQDA